MANSIAKASLLLTVDGAELDKGLAQSSDKVKTWGKDVKDVSTQAERDFGKKIKGPELPTLKPIQIPDTQVKSSIKSSVGTVSRITEARPATSVKPQGLGDTLKTLLTAVFDPTKILRDLFAGKKDDKTQKAPRVAGKADIEVKDDLAGSVERMKKWGDSVKAISDKARADFSTKFQSPELPELPEVKVKPQVPQVQQVQQAEAQVIPPRVVQAQAQSSGPGVLKLAGLVYASDRVGKAFSSLSDSAVKAGKAIEASAKPRATPPPLPQKKLEVPEGLGTKFAPTASLAAKGTPVPTKLNIPTQIPTAQAIDMSEMFRAGDMATRLPSRKASKNTSGQDGLTPSKDTRGKFDGQTQLKMPRGKGGRFDKIPVAEFDEKQFGIKGGPGDNMPRRLDVPLARLAREDRIKPGVMEARRALPPLKSEINIPSLKRALPPPLPSLPSVGPGGPVAGPTSPLGGSGGPGGAATGLSGMSGLAKIALPIAAIAAGVLLFKKLSDIVSEVADKMRLAGHAANDLGVGLEGFNKISYAARAAGVAESDLQAGLTKLQETLNASDTEAGRVFSQVGLSVEDLRKLPVDEAVGKIADALKGITDPAAQAKAGVAIFGDSFSRLAPLLNKGEAGLAELAREAKKLGIAFGEADSSKLQGAAENIRRLGESWEGLKITLATALGPAIEAITSLIISVKDSFSGLGDQIDTTSSSGSSALKGITQALGYVVDSVLLVQGVMMKVEAVIANVVAVVVDVVSNVTDALTEAGSAFWDEFGEPITFVFDAIKEAISEVADWFVDKWNEAVETFTDAWNVVVALASTITDALPTPVKEAVEAVVGWFTWLKDKLSDAWNYIKNLFKKTKAGDAVREIADGLDSTGDKLIDNFGGTADKIGDAFDKIEDRAAKAKDNLGKVNPISELQKNIIKGISELEQELEKSMQNIGKTGAEIKIADLTKQGASDEQLKKVKELAETAKNVEIAFQNIEMPPLEKFDRAVAGLDTLLANGRLTLEQYQAGLGKAAQTLQSSVGDAQTKTVSGQLMDSKESTSTIIKAQLQADRQDPQAELKRAMIEAQEVRKAQLETSKGILKALQEREDAEFDML